MKEKIIEYAKRYPMWTLYLVGILIVAASVLFNAGPIKSLEFVGWAFMIGAAVGGLAEKLSW